jgi:hypothetical protein
VQYEHPGVQIYMHIVEKAQHLDKEMIALLLMLPPIPFIHFGRIPFREDSILTRVHPPDGFSMPR